MAEDRARRAAASASAAPTMSFNNAAMHVLTNRPLQMRNTTTSEDYAESEIDTEDGFDDGILTPTSMQARASGLDDLPPTYEQAQAHSLRTLSSAQQRSPEASAAYILPEPQGSQQILQAGAQRIQQGPPQPIHGIGTKPDAGRLTSTHNWGDYDVVRSGHESRPSARLLEAIHVAIPPARSTDGGRFRIARAYSLKLSNLGMPSTTFCSFIDGLNELLPSSPDSMTARRDVLSIADPVGEDESESAARISDYLSQANMKEFAAKGLYVSLQTVPDLIKTLPLEKRGRQQEATKLRKAIWDSKGEKEAAAALKPHIEPLTWSTPLVASKPSLRPAQLSPSSHQRQGSTASMREMQCPWEFDAAASLSDQPTSTSMPDWYTPFSPYSNTNSISSDRGEPRTHHATAALSNLLEDSGTDSDASTASNTESRIHSHNRLVEAHRHHASVVRGIERHARWKMFGLGDHPPHHSVIKYESKRCAKLNHAAAMRHAAEVEYSTKTIERRHRRYARWLDRQLKVRDNVPGEVRREHARRVQKEAQRHAERVKMAGEDLVASQSDRALDTHETVSGWSAGRGKLAWEVWVVVRNIQDGTTGYA